MKRFAVIGLHVGYWMIYALLILLFGMMGSVVQHHVFVRHLFFSAFWRNPGWVFLLVPALIAFYAFYTLLFTRFLQKRRLLLLLISAVLVSLFSGVTAIGLMRLIYKVPFHISTDTGFPLIAIAMIAMVNGVLALVMRGFIAWYSELRLKEELTRKNYEMELALIKSQISPHFLFNTLNNIDVLIGMDATRASAYLNKLSDILRFMLYETKTAQIPLAKELGYIEKYIELQRIRTANPQSISYSVEGQTGQLMVEPMLFIPFIENAFKYTQQRADNAIRIRFVLDEQRIVFDCENRYNPDAGKNAEPYNGLGNSLIRKRLLLLYPDRHSLEINTVNDIYQAKLTLNAHAN